MNKARRWGVSLAWTVLAVTQVFGSQAAARADGSVAVVEYAVPTAGSGPTEIVLGPDGRHLWFTEFSGNKIGRISENGQIREFAIPTAASAPDGIAVGPDHEVWFAEVLGNKIGRLTKRGAFSEFVVPTQGARPSVITAGPGADLWFTERGSAVDPG